MEGAGSDGTARKRRVRFFDGPFAHLPRNRPRWTSRLLGNSHDGLVCQGRQKVLNCTRRGADGGEGLRARTHGGAAAAIDGVRGPSDEGEEWQPSGDRCSRGRSIRPPEDPREGERRGSDATTR